MLSIGGLRFLAAVYARVELSSDARISLHNGVIDRILLQCLNLQSLKSDPHIGCLVC